LYQVEIRFFRAFAPIAGDKHVLTELTAGRVRREVDQPRLNEQYKLVYNVLNACNRMLKHGQI